MSNPLLRLDHISYSYHSLHGETKALKDISFEVNEGEFLAIIGPSGCGKSTLLSIISGLLTPETGTMEFHGSKIGYMLQRDNLLEWRSIYRNVTLGLEINHLVDDAALSYVDKLLKEYGLYEFKDKRPSELSGGMKQRAALIRTLALHPSLLLLDEPFSALDYQTRLNVSADIAGLIKNTGKTVIMITHDLSEAISLADRVIVLGPRPSTVIRQLPIELTLTEDTPLAPRNAPEFASYFNMLWEDLNHEKE